VAAEHAEAIGAAVEELVAAVEQEAGKAAAVAAEAAVERVAAELVSAEIEAAIEQVAECVAEAAEKAAAEKAAAEKAAAEKAAAAKARRVEKAAKRLSPDKGYVEAAFLITRLEVKSTQQCMVCLFGDEERSTNPCDSAMQCCSQHIHIECLHAWHAEASKGALIRAPSQEVGGTKLVAMENCHKCPMCRGEQKAARGPPRERLFVAA
jgi:hypothetical protein